MNFVDDYNHTLDQAGDVPISELGVSANPFEHPIQSLKARIFHGASRVEFTFMGKGKGSKQSITPETFGKDERRDLWELATYNNIKFTAHASPNAGALSGLGQNGFSAEERENALKEIRRAIDFAAEATTGGPVVFHTGEMMRNISKADPNFLGYDEEENQEQFFVVDDRTGRFIDRVSKDERIFEPVYKTAESEGLVGTKVVDRRGRERILKEGDYIDLNNRYLDPKNTDDMFYRVPQFDKDNVKFKVEEVTWDHLEKRAETWNKDNPDKRPKTAHELYIETKIENKILQAKGQSLFHGRDYWEALEERNKAKEALDFYEKLEKDMSEEEKRKMMVRGGYGRYIGEGRQFVPGELKTPRQILHESVESADRYLRYIHESSGHADVQVKELEETKEHIMNAEEYAVEKAAETVAKAAMYALEKDKAIQKRAKKEGVKTDTLYVSPEAYEPKFLGSHPDEIIDIIKRSREQFVQDLRKYRHMPEKEARELAKKHIKGTVDSGHYNMWRQYFKPKNGESDEEFEKRYNKWYLDNAKKMAKGGYIGHVHLSDNFGFDDEHVTPGQGNAPIKEFVDIMRKEGKIDDFIIETGSFNINDSMPDTWRLFGSPIYGLDGGRMGLPTTWGDVQGDYFGKTSGPRYIIGEYAPSEEFRGAPYFSGVPLE